MTEITSSELKIIYIQITFMALLGVFMALYASEPIPAQTLTLDEKDASFLEGLVSLPEGFGELVYISALVITPFLIFDSIILIRFAKDIITNWI